MSTISNIERLIIPSSDIFNLTTLYKWIGQNEVFKQIARNDMKVVMMQTVERDTFFLSLILNLDISDNRARLIITKDSLPRTKDETTLYNIKEMLMMIQNDYDNIGYYSNDLYNMINEVLSHYNPIKFDTLQNGKKSILQSQNFQSKRLLVDEVSKQVDELVKNKSFEKITLYLHFFLDFYNIKPFVSFNELSSILLLYLLVLKCDIECFKFVSFFELLYTNFDEFKKELNNASYNWKEGYAQTIEFVRFMYKLFLQGYEKTNQIINNYKFDQSLNKSSNIENTISTLNDVFTKEDIRMIHPYVSESTINRSLTKLRDEGFIRPLGKGRSAKWTKIKNR